MADYAMQIESEINTLIRANPYGPVEYQLPTDSSGILNLARPIVILPAQGKLSIYGNGMILQPLTDYDQLFRIGANHAAGAISQWAAYASYSIAEAASGQLYVDIAAAPNLPDPERPFYAVIYNTLQQGGQYVRQELVRVNAYETTLGRAYLDMPLCHDYVTVGGVLPKIVLCDEDVMRDVTLADVAINGSPVSDYDTKTQIAFWLGLGDVVTVENVTGSRFETDLVRCEFCRQVDVDQVIGRDSVLAGAGLGRVVCFHGCTYSSASRVSARDARHAVTFSQGTAQSSMSKGDAADMGDAAWDMGHGLGCRDLSGTELSGGDIQLGNGTYPDGVPTVTLTDCDVDTVRGIGSVTNLTARRVKAKYGNLQGTVDGGTDKYPTSLRFENCQFNQSDPDYVGEPFSITGFGATQKAACDAVQFYDCQFLQANSAGGRRCFTCDEGKTKLGLSFVRCDFLQTGTGTPLRLQATGGAPYPALDLFVTQCSFRAPATNAINLGANTSGTYNITNNREFAVTGTPLDNDGLATGPAVS